MVSGDFLKEEHTRLLVDLQTLSMGRTSINATFEEILRIFEYHLDREEETTVPLLRFLSERMISKDTIDLDHLRAAKEGFLAEYQNMISEHRQMLGLLQRLEELPDYRHDAYARDLSDALKIHVGLEEQILYPAAIAAGELIK